MLKFANMMTDLGHEVFVYGGERCDARCKESVTIVSKAQREEWFKRYNWETDVFNGWDSNAVWWRHMNIAASAEILRRSRPGDFACIISGYCQQMLSDLGLPAVEWGVGYQGVLPNTHRCFESYAWLHHLAAKEPQDDIRFFDTVIPNSFEVADFPAGNGGGDFVFLGRLIHRKGPHIAAEACNALGARLTLAGQGVNQRESGVGRVVGQDGVIVEGQVNHIGRVNPQERAKLLGQAKAVFVPTLYLEPFGGVAVEAMLCGTPVITTDHGAFTEYVENGFNGFRCRTLADFVRAAELSPCLDRAAIRAWAIKRFSTDAIAPKYEAWFRQLQTLGGEGWYDLS